MTQLSNVKQAVTEIEKQFPQFENLSISFFDTKKNCGYMINGLIEMDSTGNIINMDIRDVQHHWYAEYTAAEHKLEYMKYGNCEEVRRTYYLKNGKFVGEK